MQKGNQLNGIVGTISRYVRLTGCGREFRGQCPFCRQESLIVCPAYDNRKHCFDSYGPNRWCCLACGAHEHGITPEAFILLARRAELHEGKPRKPLPEPRRAPARWARILPPFGSQPDFAPSWLGTPDRIEAQRDEHGRLTGYRATYPAKGAMYWIYVRYSESDPGMWKCRRPSIKERVAARYPDIPAEVAKKIQGRATVSLAELSAGDNPCGYRAKAIAFALRAQGWIKKREFSGRRSYYYTPA